MRISATPLPSLVLTVVLACLAAAGPAAAQSASETAVARRAYRAGMQAARDERWQDALASFERAYSLVGRPRILVNLATAQVQTGQLVEGAESYRRFLREAAEDSKLRPKVERELADVEERTPEVTIYVSGLQAGDRLAVDGDTVSRAVVGAPVPLDPGAHEVTVSRDGRTVARASVELEEKEQRGIRLQVGDAGGEAGGATGTDGTTGRAGDDGDATGGDGTGVLGGDQGDGDTEPRDDGGVLSSPWFWTAVGVAVAAGAATALVLTVGSSQPSPHTGNVPPGMYEP